jgi:hypothetical protein
VEFVPFWTGARRAKRQVFRAANAAARSDVDDETARKRVASAIETNRRGIKPVLAHLEAARPTFISDRSRRLLTAVSEDSPNVAPPPSQYATIFRREEELGRLPINEAFRSLIAIEPRLAGITATGSDLAMVLGPLASGGDDLSRSDLALSIASHYLEAQSEDGPELDTGCAYFDAPLVRVVLTGRMM